MLNEWCGGLGGIVICAALISNLDGDDEARGEMSGVAGVEGVEGLELIFVCSSLLSSPLVVDKLEPCWFPSWAYSVDIIENGKAHGICSRATLLTHSGHGRGHTNTITCG